MPTPDSKMKQRIEDLKLTIIQSGKVGVNLIALVNRFGCEHGVRKETVKEYVKMLEAGGYVVERNNRVYEVSTV